MLSPLARGYGSWTGDIDLCHSDSNTNDTFPTVGYPDPHRHGVTVSPRSHAGTPGTAASHRTRFESTEGKIPKTFLTRKGALLLFTAPDNDVKEGADGSRTVHNHRKGKKLLDLSLKLGTLDRLCRSVLQYGDEPYDRENSSVTDPRNRLFLKFIHQTSELDDGQFDVHSQPGADLGFYLRDLKTRASSRLFSEGDPRSRTRSPELRSLLKDLDGALPLHRRSTTCTDFTESPRGSPKQRVLSSRKLAASIKSSTYLGRPSSAVSLSETTSSESAANLPCITSQSSSKSRSRTSSKSGLWVQGYDQKPKPESKSPSKPSSAKSRPSQRSSSKVESLKTQDVAAPTLPTEEDATSAAEEQDIVLPSDGEEEEEEGFQKDEMWPAADEGEGDVEGDKTTLQMTQPLMPQYKVGGIVEDLEVPLEEDEEKKLTDGQEKQDTPGADSAQAGIQEVHVVTRLASPGEEVAQKSSPMSSPSLKSNSSKSPPQLKGKSEHDSLNQSPRVSPTGSAQHGLEREHVTLEEGAEDATEAEDGKGENQINSVTDPNAVADAVADDAHVDVKDDAHGDADVTADVNDDEEVELTFAVTDPEVEDNDEDVTVADPDAVLAAVDLEEQGQDASPDCNAFEDVKDETKPEISKGPDSSTRSPSGMDVDSPPMNEPLTGADDQLEEPNNVENVDAKQGSPVVERDERLDKSPSGESNQEDDPKDGLHNDGTVNDQEEIQQEGDFRQIEEVKDPSDEAMDDENKEAAAETPESDFIFKDGTETSGITTPESALQGKPDQVPDVPEQGSPHASESQEQALVDSRQSPSGTEAMEDTSGLPTDASQGPPQGIASGSPQSVASGSPQDDASGSPQDAALGSPQDLASGLDSGSADASSGSRSTKPPTEGLSLAAPQAEGKSWAPGLATESVSPTPSLKSRVTFDEKVTTQSIPKTPPQPTKQPQPPKTKPTSRPTPKARVPAKGGNQKTGKTPKSFVKAMDITSVQPEEENKDEPEAPPEKKARQKLAPKRHVETNSDKTKSSVLPSHMEEVLNRRSASKSHEELELEMAQMRDAIESTLAGPTLSVDTGEGLTEEELKLAQEALMERVKQAESQIEDVAKKEVKKPTRPVKAVDSKSRKKKNVPQEEKRNLQQEQAAIREQRKKEKLERLEEAKALQEKIRAREAERRAKEEEAKRKAQQLAEEIAELKREENEIQQAEEDARHQLAQARKAEREARDKRRKEDLERKKQEAIRRREKEKKMADAARQKEEEMLKRIADNEMKRRLQEEEMRKREEEERIAQEQYEEELKQAQREAEEEELRMRELEKEAEEEAMQRLIEEREEAERRRWKLNELARQMEEEEARKRQVLVEEEQRLEAEKKRREEEEQQKLEEERRRLQQLERMEAEARMNMHLELSKRKELAQKRREANLERRENLDNTRHGQGITRAWVFSYFPEWPIESYNKLMGEDAKSKKGFRPRPKPKPKEPTPQETQPEAEQPSGETT